MVEAKETKEIIGNLGPVLAEIHGHDANRKPLDDKTVVNFRRRRRVKQDALQLAFRR
jgi:hypothetical protein